MTLHRPRIYRPSLTNGHYRDLRYVEHKLWLFRLKSEIAKFKENYIFEGSFSKNIVEQKYYK